MIHDNHDAFVVAPNMRRLRATPDGECWLPPSRDTADIEIFATANVPVRMITVGVIRNGETYLTQHLRQNDYWAEGEKEVLGEWIGQGAKALGLVGAVEEKAFEALRQNRDPRTGEVLTVRDAKRRMALFDVQLSHGDDAISTHIAPKTLPASDTKPSAD